MAHFEWKRLQASTGEPSIDSEFADVDIDQKQGFKMRSFRSSAYSMKDQTYAYADEVSQYARSASARFSTRQVRMAFASVAFVGLLFFMFGRGVGGSAMAAFGVTTTLTSSTAFAMQETGPWKKPSGFKIIGMVFYGRPLFVDILDCYLQKNLAANGGYLDEIHFMAHTNKEEDLEWLDEFVATNDKYSRVDISGDYSSLWREHATDADTMYLKIDDDIVFIHDDALPRIVHTLLAHPEAYAVASNLINSPVTSWLHHHGEAIHPYLPKPSKPTETVPIDEWRPSLLPAYPNASIPQYWNVSVEPPFQGHRWLPLPRTSANLRKTPIINCTYDAWGPAWTSWGIAAQQHYSFLENLERNELTRYWMGNPTGIWNLQYYHYNVNFLAIWGRTLLSRPFFGMDDEWAMTEGVPSELSMPFLVDSHSIVSHYAFHPQGNLTSTDILGRYRALANERVCAANNQKKPLTGLRPDAANHDYGR